MLRSLVIEFFIYLLVSSILVWAFSAMLILFGGVRNSKPLIFLGLLLATLPILIFVRLDQISDKHLEDFYNPPRTTYQVEDSEIYSRFRLLRTSISVTYDVEYCDAGTPLHIKIENQSRSPIVSLGFHVEGHLVDWCWSEPEVGCAEESVAIYKSEELFYASGVEIAGNASWEGCWELPSRSKETISPVQEEYRPENLFWVAKKSIENFQ